MHHKREEKFDWHDGGAILTKDVLIKHTKKLHFQFTQLSSKKLRRAWGATISKSVMPLHTQPPFKNLKIISILSHATHFFRANDTSFVHLAWEWCNPFFQPIIHFLIKHLRFFSLIKIEHPKEEFTTHLPKTILLFVKMERNFQNHWHNKKGLS